MGITYNKKEREKKKRRKKKEKAERREEKREQETSGKLEDMMAYVDEYGNIVDSPPEEDKGKKKEEIKAEDIVVGVPKKEKEDLTAERRGKVSFFNEGKGYGFINQSETQERYFVHATGLKQPVYEGDKVKFTLEEGPKGLVAVNVEKI